ncbi:MAG: proline--tRNA ligase [Acidobacteria bacterium]|nr:MAG: proline--tRNA ligase [Acidobacteriota bacterium]
MHRWSQLFIPTLREAPADAEVASHKFLVRAGYVRQLAAGIYSYLFLGQRSVNKVISIVRDEMDKIGQEFLLPALHPRELWESSGRWSVMGDNMFRLKDRSGRDLCLGMTHEEVMTEIARKELRSYKQLPQIWYQIQTKFRDEPRPKSGLLRVRQFIMKDAYSFDIDAGGLDVSYHKHYDVYSAIFTRCGLRFVVAEAHSGAMGGSQSHEFMVYTDAGEDMVASCPKCGYAANLEKATSRLESVEDLKVSGNGSPELVHTPGMKTIEEVAKYLGVSPKQKIKTLALVGMWITEEGKRLEWPIAVFVRGDHMLNEAKLLAVTGAREVRPMHGEEIESIFKAPAGFLGPVGLDMDGFNTGGVNGMRMVYVDKALEGRTNLIAGANKEDYHLRNVTPGRDFAVKQYADVRNVEAGEGCPNCGTPIVVAKAVEVGHIFKLGYKYSESMGARVLDQAGKEVAPIMGSYGIGIERILTSAIEQSNDNDGFWLPRNIAPFDVVVTPTNVSDSAIRSAGEDVSAKLTAAGFDVLLDDREDRAGVKFKDADLVGVPYRINVGKKVSEGKVELVQRSTRQSVDASMTEITEKLRQIAQ